LLASTATLTTCPPNGCHDIETTKDFTAETEQKMHKAVQDFKKRFIAARKEKEVEPAAAS